jgi:hypothetical protein
MSAMSVAVVAFGVGNLRVFDTALSSPAALDAVSVTAVGIIAPPASTAARPIEQGRPARAATPTPLRALARTGLGTDRRAATRVSGAAVEPVLAPEASPVAAITPVSASQPVPALMLTPTTGLAPLGLPAVAASGTASRDSSPAVDDNGRATWGAAADAGKAIGRGSQGAAAAAAGVFTRFGRTVTGSF